MTKKFDNIQKTVSELKKDNKKLKEQNVQLTEKVKELSTTVAELECSAKQNERNYKKLKAQSRRENLRFFYVEESQNETWDQSEQTIRDFISGTLGIDDSSIQIERAHRLSAKTTSRLLIARFSFYKDKDKVLKRYREIRKAERESRLSDGQHDGADGAAVDNGQSLKVRVSEDFPERGRKVRALLVTFLNQA